MKVDLRTRVEQAIEEHYDAALVEIRAPHQEFLDRVEKRRAPWIEATLADTAAATADEEAAAAESEAWSADMRGDNKAKSRARERYTTARACAEELREKARAARARAEEFDEVAAAADLKARTTQAVRRLLPERPVTGMDAERRAMAALREAAEAAEAEVEARKDPTDPWVGVQVVARARAEERAARSEAERIERELAEVKAANTDAFHRAMASKGGRIPDNLKPETQELAGITAETYRQGRRLELELAETQGRAERARWVVERAGQAPG